jgi:hypothetical protein
LGGGQGLVGGFGGGLTTTGGTITGGTITGGTITGGTTTGGTTTGGTTTGGTTTFTGGTFTGSGTEIVTVPGLLPAGGVLLPVPVDPEVDGVPVTEVEGVGGVAATTGVVGVTAVVGAGVADGVTDGVGVPVAECSFGTTMSGLPPPEGGAEPK